ncbi:Kinesin motor domain [Phytophthora infestans]|uniref:Kinesin-like protein n=1 Tax=Phytophthora infestans TaxID=4787 RepID=A0A8S9TUS1_PHYIN|nr:Kinesin motor domain [Phytophthora infestans]
MEKEEKIRVVVRARPYVCITGRNGSTPRSSTRKKRGNDQECVAASPENPGELFVYTDPAHTRAAAFRCETFLPSTASQEDVFDQIHAKELVDSALDGFPVTIFAYGQTGAGKSFTIFGNEDDATLRKTALQEQDGLLPRIAQALMNSVSARKSEIEYTLRVTCVEIYNEQVRDVFDPRKETLAVRFSKTHGFFLENATVVECMTAREIVRVVRAAATQRTKSSHLLNERSNRSHCLVTIYIDAAPLKSTSSTGKRYGKITIVDLAGSERVSDSGAVGTQLRESCHINRSLHCLSQVIQAINTPKCSKTGKARFVPFRDSKLTMLLLDSLGGNCKTLMIACVNSSSQFAVESVRTLEFAMGVAKIKNRPTALLTPHEKLIKDLKEQIRLLKLENRMLRARTPGYFMDHSNNELGPFVNAFSEQSIRQQFQTCDEPMYLSADSLEAVHRMTPSVRQNVAHQELRTLKQKSQLRHASKSPKRKVLKRMSKSFTNKHALPYVSKSAPSRSLQYIAQNFEPAHPNQSANRLVLPRTDSPPPPYNDLFGIETVPCSQSQPPSNSSSPHLPLARSVQTQPFSNNRDTILPAKSHSPEEQLQLLLRQMLPEAHPPQNKVHVPERTDKRHKMQQIPSKPPKTPGYAPLMQKNYLPVSKNDITSNNSADWDDQRAQDLFMQLCRL